MVTVAEADRILAGQIPDPAPEAVPLGDAVGRILGPPVLANRDAPPFHRVARDGYAVGSAGHHRTWTVEARGIPGTPALRRSGPAGALEVAAGAVLPEGCDAVIPYEDTERHGDVVTLKAHRPLPVRGQLVHRRGSEYLRGDILLEGGIRLRSPHLHSLAAEGVDPVGVVRRPLWALVTTGAELVAGHEVPQPWQIRRTNGPALVGEAAAWGLHPWDQMSVPDDRDHLRNELIRLLPGLEALVLTGGLSSGLLDLVPGVLGQLGVEPLFDKIDQQPGDALWCGWFPRGIGTNGTMVFGLPGAPAASLIAFRRYVLPWLLAAEGRPLVPGRVRAEGLEPPPGSQTVFLPWSVTEGPLGWAGSSDYQALGRSSGFVEYTADPRSLAEPLYHPWG